MSWFHEQLELQRRTRRLQKLRNAIMLAALALGVANLVLWLVRP